MDKQPVGQLPDLTQSNNDDEIMVITNSEYNQLKKEKISDLITDFTSTNENNALTKGTDGKMFVTDFGNASNITEGTLQTSVLPQIPTEKLPQTGVEAGEYSYPSSVTVNAQGQITAIEEGQTGANNANQDLSNLSPEGEKHFLNKSQVTNCMLEAPNGIATYSGTTVTVQEGTNYLFPNGRNANNTLQNTTFTAASNITGTMSGSTAGTFVVFVTSESSLIFANNINYFITSTEPTALNDTTSQGVWYNPVLNTLSQCAATSGAPSWSTFEGARCATLTYDGSAITAFNPVYPVELLKKSDLQEIFEIGNPIITLSNTLGENEIWLEGAEVSRETYAVLFEIYGTTYGEGDGETTFNLPDFRNRTIWGAEDFGYIEAGLPNITGGIRTFGYIQGAFYETDIVPGYANAQHSNTSVSKFDASRSSSIYGNSSTVQPPSVKVRVKTRYA